MNIVNPIHRWAAEGMMNRTSLILVALMLFACVPSQNNITRNIFYVGGDNKVKAALIRAGYTLADDFENADVFVLNGDIPDVNAIASKVEDGAGLVLIAGKEMSFRDVEVLFGYPVSSLINAEITVTLVVDEYLGKNDPLINESDWNDAPQIRDRALIMTSAPGKPLIRVNGYVEVVIGEIGKTSERKIALEVFLDEQHNMKFQEWRYFDYLIYNLVERAAGAEPLSFTDFTQRY